MKNGNEIIKFALTADVDTDSVVSCVERVIAANGEGEAAVEITRTLHNAHVHLDRPHHEYHLSYLSHCVILVKCAI